MPWTDFQQEKVSSEDGKTSCSEGIHSPSCAEGLRNADSSFYKVCTTLPAPLPSHHRLQIRGRWLMATGLDDFCNLDEAIHQNEQYFKYYVHNTSGFKLEIKSRGRSNSFGKVVMKGLRTFHIPITCKYSRRSVREGCCELLSGSKGEPWWGLWEVWEKYVCFMSYSYRLYFWLYFYI